MEVTLEFSEYSPDKYMLSDLQIIVILMEPVLLTVKCLMVANPLESVIQYA